MLLVEDEAVLAEAIAEGLTAEGFVVEVTGDGLDGLWRARERAYGAIVLDLLLPGMNGFEICRSLRAEGVRTPILVLTAKDGEYDEAEALDTGADDFLSKPFSFVVLVARLRALLRRDASRTGDAMEVGDLVLDPAARRCARAGAVVELTARELDVLEALMRRAGEVVPSRLLLEDVWGHEFDGDPNIVRVYIGYLRRKIDVPFGRQSLQTLRGSGYRLVADA